MPATPLNPDGESGWNIQTEILGQLSEGATKKTVLDNLVSGGMARTAAVQVVDQAYTQYLDELERERFKEQFTLVVILPAIIGGALSAIVGGAIWGAIVIWTGRAYGAMALVVGLASGFGVLLFARGRRGPLLQGVATFSGMLGILVGKHITTFYFLRLKIAEDYGADAAARLSIWSPGVIQFFAHNLNLLLTLYDCVFIVLAMLVAWKIPSESDVVS